MERQTEAQQFQELILQTFVETKQLEGKEAFVVLGLTGSGKSTIINYLLGNKLEFREIDEEDFILLSQANPNAPKIGTSVESETLFPRLYRGKGVSCLDTAGFIENRGKKYQAIANIGIRVAIKMLKVKGILLVIEYPSLVSARGDGMRQLTSILSNLIKQPKEVQNSLYFIITKVTDVRLTPAKVAKKMKEILDSQSKTDLNEDTRNFFGLLKLIVDNPEKICLIDVLAPENVETLIQTLNKLQCLDKKYLNTDQDQSLGAFKEILNLEIQTSYETLMIHEESKKRIQGLTKKIEEEEARICSLEEKFSKEDTDYESELQENLQQRKNEIRQAKQEIAENKMKITEKETEKYGLEGSTNASLLYQKNVSIGDSWFGNKLIIEHQGKPYVWHERVTHSGEYKVVGEVSDPSKGRYNATFETPVWSNSVSGVLNFYCYEKDADSTRTKCQLLFREIAVLQIQQQEKAKEIEELKWEMEKTQAQLNQGMEREKAKLEFRNLLCLQKNYIADDKAELEREKEKFKDLEANLEEKIHYYKTLGQIIKSLELKDRLYQDFTKKLATKI